MNIKPFISVVLCCNILIAGFSQGKSVKTDVPEVGKMMPDYTFTWVDNYKAPAISVKDFRGKWLVLDFWYRGCASCIRSFPKVNDLQKKFSDKVQFVFVGENSKMAFGKDLDKLYKGLQQKLGLVIPAAFDSVATKNWDVFSFPYILIIDPAGIVQHITTGIDLNEKKLTDMLNGKPVRFSPRHAGRIGPEFDPEATTSSLLYRSVLAKWNGEHQRSAGAVVGNESQFTTHLTHIDRLYNLAYIGLYDWSFQRDSLFGNVYPHLILETKKTALFEGDYRDGYITKGFYNYDLQLPAKKSREEIMQIMQRDLREAFGVEATLETRMVPVYKLVALPGVEKIRSKDKVYSSAGYHEGDGGAAGFSFKKGPMWHLMDKLPRHLDHNTLPIYDETGIDFDMDIDMDVHMLDIESIRKGLQKNHLDLVKSTKEMKAIVIRDLK